MINAFNLFSGILILSQIILIMLLLKPIKEAGFTRDFWYKFKQNYTLPSNLMLILSLCLLFNLIFGIAWESNTHASLMKQVEEKELIRRFYVSEFAIGITCSFVSISLLILLEKIVYLTFKIAELLDFELMCRHAILSKNETARISNASIVLPALLKYHILKQKCK